VLGRVEDPLGRPALDQLPVAHHHDVVGDLGHHPHVVGDEHHRHAVFRLQAADQIQDLGLGGDVQGGGRLVGDQHRGVAGQRHRDHRALPHAARILEGVAVDRALGIGDLDLAQELDRACLHLLLRHRLVQADRLHDLEADGVHGRERAHRLLEDHRHVLAADRAHGARLRLHGGEVDRLLHPAAVPGQVAVEEDAAGGDPARVVDDLQDRARGDALARARFADDAKRPAVLDLEAHPVDGAKGPGPGRELGHEVVDLEHGTLCAARRCGRAHLAPWA
jgi:hypothetical protein